MNNQIDDLINELSSAENSPMNLDQVDMGYVDDLNKRVLKKTQYANRGETVPGNGGTNASAAGLSGSKKPLYDNISRFTLLIIGLVALALIAILPMKFRLIIGLILAVIIIAIMIIPANKKKQKDKNGPADN